MEENDYGIFEKCEQPSEEVCNSKKSNVRYWDGMEAEVEELIKVIGEHGGIRIKEFKDYDLIKQVTELITKNLTEQYGTEFPFVDENY